MLDRRFILDHLDAVKANCAQRCVQVDLDQLVQWETVRRQLDAQVQDLNRKANETAKSIGKAKDDVEREACKEEGRRLRASKDAAQQEHDALDARIIELQRTIPNMTHPAAPLGADESSSREIRKGKSTPRKFDFKPIDHVELGQNLSLLDFDGGARTTGHGFYFLKNEAVLLELALQQFAVHFLVQRGFTPTITPDLARAEILEGIGFNPRGAESQIYMIQDSDWCLVATAEITLGGLYSGHTFEAEELPLRLCGISHCYRREAGAHGRMTRGLYRVHQFTKVEMFAFSLPDQSDEILEQFCDLECQIFDALGLPYRVVDTATGDLGGPAYRKFDLEAWMPGRGEQGEYGEVTSTSNCTDYQARRLNVRFRRKGEKGTQLVHTLNGTAVALSRALLAILENYQQSDGSVLIPDVLRPYMGGVERIIRK
jgi:seryl-tRNA synthetase